MSTIPVPFGVSVKSPFELEEDISLPSIVTLSTKSSFNFLFESTISALDAVTVPAVWSNISVKNLPPIVCITAAFELLTASMNNFAPTPSLDAS